MDHMTEYELSDILENIRFTDINSWEQSRLQIYVLSSMFSKTKLKITDILKFAWEEDVLKQDPLPTTITDAEIAQLKQKAKLFENNLQT